MKNEFYILKMYFNAPLLFSKGISDYTKTTFQLFSDTIKNALYYEYISNYDYLPPDHFFTHFKISSAFPFYKDHLFFPKPFKNLLLQFSDNNNNSNNPDSSLRKKIKKIQWLHQDYFFNEILNKNYSAPLTNLTSDNKFLFNSTPPTDKFIVEEITHRLHYYYTQPFDVVRYHFSENSGLFVIIQTSNQNFLENTLIPAFKILALNGIGGYKTIGHGTFDPHKITPIPFSFPAPANPTHLINLSLYLPAQEELNCILKSPVPSFYSLIKRGGYIAAANQPHLKNLKKKSVFMFKDGSVFPYFPDNQLTGTRIDLKPNHNISHPILKDGQAIFIPIEIKNTENI